MLSERLRKVSVQLGMVWSNGRWRDTARAAKATLDRGYTHFRLQDTSLAQGSVVTGAVGSGNTNVSGTYGGGFVNANANSFGSTTVVRAPTASAAVTVLMFQANEPGAQGAFEATLVQKQYAQ